MRPVANAEWYARVAFLIFPAGCSCPNRPAALKNGQRSKAAKAALVAALKLKAIANARPLATLQMDTNVPLQTSAEYWDSMGKDWDGEIQVRPLADAPSVAGCWFE